ncbi:MULTISPECIES: ROK family protein [unclassified Clostridioides]|uniref:ROK family protein n=1 Tax=unclassified Clostridioides TaxID=2635829 RepID=UPI001D0FBF87|nr:ROK family protein [Clostridioides sp. ZZV14-6154]MCC0667349.1 ROK family protein [Clostridioides sp. ZZV14-6153]MCC0717155.1 ROK family protein [Clostridioides sp. ZZV14-6105]MCC0721040.1 ROK family protein [Clostridioides sp. ZZV14-6104]MCC0725629.1 ROK family protein [Clostridioides sp. ZZV14-6045]MCC0730372.1 ROK family protein [Clostridioides sp. ZZV14-6048]MCC0733250.1 ROK family protein [Clostridioides sp. ZZV14-6009]MCC0741151.1 ROK family protein [Clostridioides sp. ZZV14-6044]M
MYYIGVDIGGTGIQAGVVDNQGKILFRTECKTVVKKGFEGILDDIKIMIDKLLEENNLNMKEIKSIGFGVPGFINKKGLVTCVNLKWDGESFENELKRRFPNVEIHGENDATVAALGESKFGSMKGADVGVLYTLGTGVGGGIVINQKVFSGAHGLGSEIGHQVIGENYFDCNCGNNGCVETFCSATAIIKYSQKLIQEGRKSRILDLAEGDLEKINAKMVFDAYRENDIVAIEVITRFKSYLAKTFANTINTLDPEIISIGGGVSKASDIILDGIEDLVRKYILYKKEDIAKIVCATLGSDAGIIGAAFL